MTTKILKFQSSQAGPFDVANNKVDIVVPSYVGYCDLSWSCILLNLKLLKSNGSDRLQDVSFNDGLDASCMIKNWFVRIIRDPTCWVWFSFATSR